MINMTGYKVIYHDEVYNCIDLMMEWESMDITGYAKPKFLQVVIIDKDNLIAFIRDEAWTFQFVRDLKGEK